MQDMHTPHPNRPLHSASATHRPHSHTATPAPEQPSEHLPPRATHPPQPGQPPPPHAEAAHMHAPAPRALPAVAPRNITEVYTAEELQRATLRGALDVEIRTHLDLRAMRPAHNPEMPTDGGSDGAASLLFSTSPLRSIRVRLTPPGATTPPGGPAVRSGGLRVNLRHRSRLECILERTSKRQARRCACPYCTDAWTEQHTSVCRNPCNPRHAVTHPGTSVITRRNSALCRVTARTLTRQARWAYEGQPQPVCCQFDPTSASFS